jgi:hypothetical protein
MLPQMRSFHSLLWLITIALCMYHIFCIHSSITRNGSWYCEQCYNQHECRCLFNMLISFPLAIYLVVGLLDSMVVSFLGCLGKFLVLFIYLFAIVGIEPKIFYVVVLQALCHLNYALWVLFCFVLFLFLRQGLTATLLTELVLNS